MTDPIDTARPINLAEVIRAIRGKVIAVGDGRDFSYGLDTLDHALPAPAGWTWDQIEFAASHADTARHEGIALGLAMAGSAFGEWYSEATTEAIKARILALAPIPPNVAAARVLLDMPMMQEVRAWLEQIAKEGE